MKAKVLIIDVGGGSTEFILGGPKGIMARKSVDIGAVRLTEMFITKHPVPMDERANLESYVRSQIEAAQKNLPAIKSARAIAVAGTPTTLATLDQGLPFESERVDGYELPLSRILFWFDRLAGMSVEERRQLAGMEPKRADVIVAGALILRVAAEIFNVEKLEVSIRGLRYGIAQALGTR
jgi:exopolyphosphatase/guanosine-5'-triphosphate,3'-diphosphate pyrophosphatase